jgi:hypothetical protein
MIDRALAMLQVEASQRLWVWLTLGALAIFFCNLLLDLRLNILVRRWRKTGNRHPRHLWLLRISDSLSVLAIVAFVWAALLLPAVPAGQFDVGIPRELLLMGLLALVIATTTAMVTLELWPWWHRTVARLGWRSVIVFVLSTATTLTLLLFLLLVASLTDARNIVLADLVFCGVLTLYRGIRTRVRGGDHPVLGLWGSIVITLQFENILCQAASAATFLIMGVLWLFHLVPFPADPLADLRALLGLADPPADLMAERSSLIAGVETFALMLGILAFAYLVLYAIRRLMGARGFSWIDAPNARVMAPHAKYKIHTWLGSDFSLADVVRQALLEAIVGPRRGARFEQALAEAAQVQAPLNAPDDRVRFLIIGDPGEGDDSQLHPDRKQEGTAKEQLMQSAVKPPREKQGQAARGAAPAIAEAPPDQAAVGQDRPDFILICTDIIYPAGEMIDYERAFYRPYDGTDVPFYAIPGNHDWYDHLRGFFANFVFPAAHAGTGFRDALNRMPWAHSPLRRLDWGEVERWREEYGLEKVGGVRDDRATHQRLSFLEIAFGDWPLTVFALDNGVTGSMDRIQYHWLDRRLGALRDASAPGFNPYHRIVVLVGIPLYVDGAFSGARLAPEHKRRERHKDSYGMREIYELLRRRHVDVVMGGDTHAYQRYTVEYKDGEATNKTYKMYHIVNGGGGAYLSPPVDSGWFDFEDSRLQGAAADAPGQAGAKLSRRTVYRSEQGCKDEVTLHKVYPTANELKTKFAWRVKETYRLPERSKRLSAIPSLAWLPRLVHAWDVRRQQFQGWFSQRALDTGFTNALDHDRKELLQSYVEVSLALKAGRYALAFTAHDANGDELDRLTLDAGAEARSSRSAQSADGGEIAHAIGRAADAAVAPAPLAVEQ